MTSKKQTVPVSTRALLQRINRVLDRKQEVLRRSRGANAVQNLGEYYILDYYRNAVIYTNVNLESEGRELKCLGPHEHLAE